MQSLVLSQTNLSLYGLEEKDFSELNKRTVVVTKWNWDYQKAHAFQRHALGLVQNSHDLRILITCNHPEVLTNGRGLQKPKKGESFDLVEFNPKEHMNLPYPLHQIERGGGLTFHHPGQFIFYPIVKLNPKTLSLSNMIDQIFDFSIDIFRSWGGENLHHENKLLGLWHGEKKLGSMGIAIEKLTTFHGMAINFYRNDNMIRAMRSLNPCGLNTEIYTSVEEFLKIDDNSLYQFNEQFLERPKHEWQ